MIHGTEQFREAQHPAKEALGSHKPKVQGLAQPSLLVLGHQKLQGLGGFLNLPQLLKINPSEHWHLADV